RAVALLDEGLLQEAHLLEEALDLTLHHALDDLLRLARLAGTPAVDGALGLDLGRRHLLASDVARRRRRDLHPEILHELLELHRLRDEVGLAVDLDQDADLAPGVDVGADQPVRGRARRLLRGLRETALAQEPDGLFDVARGFAERL